MRLFSQLLLAAGLLTAGNLLAADTNSPAPLRKVAIIVENHAGAQFNDKVAVLEDLLSSRIAGEGYSVISRSVTVNALKSYDTAGIAVSSQTALKNSAGSASAQNSAASALARRIRRRRRPSAPRLEMEPTPIRRRWIWRGMIQHKLPPRKAGLPIRPAIVPPPPWIWRSRIRRRWPSRRRRPSWIKL